MSNAWIQEQLAAIDALFGSIVEVLDLFLFADFGSGLPLIVAVLLLGGIYYSFYFSWLTIRAFRHSIDVIRGRYDDPSDPGEISHFQALTSALSATIGLGNIAGVAIAVSVGGPGAVFWMVITALFGMASKLASCTLAVMYRRIHPGGRIAGGPMYYMEQGLGAKGWPEFGRTLAVLFAVLTIGGSLGGGNMFQANQTLEVLGTVHPGFRDFNWAVGLLMALLVGLVIIGGIRRIGRVTSRIVPFMCLLYVAVSPVHHPRPHRRAAGPDRPDRRRRLHRACGRRRLHLHPGLGIRRAAFSNEAGLGSAAFAHAAAKTNEAAREGIVAMIGPFIDTIVICMMTALVCLLTGVYQDPQFQSSGGSIVGARMTAAAFESFIPGRATFWPWPSPCLPTRR